MFKLPGPFAPNHWCTCTKVCKSPSHPPILVFTVTCLLLRFLVLFFLHRADSIIQCHDLFSFSWTQPVLRVPNLHPLFSPSLWWVFSSAFCCFPLPEFLQFPFFFLHFLTYDFPQSPLVSNKSDFYNILFIFDFPHFKTVLFSVESV